MKKRLTIPRKVDISIGFTEYDRRWSILIMWGYNNPPEGRTPGMAWFTWNHFFAIVIDPEAWHNLGISIKRCLPRFLHG